jgi:4'-phosphopantetheinyl transferase
LIYWHVCPAEDCAAGNAAQLDFLSASERKTFDRLRFPKRRQEWLLGRWTAKQLLQRSLNAYRGVPLAGISVNNDPDGAPYLSVEGEGRLPASLSISHRAGRAVCALSPAMSPSIGVDVEHVEPRAASFVNDFFTADEARRVWACSEVQRDTLVTAIWSAKESVLKGLRKGLRLDTRSVEIGPVVGIECPPLVPETEARSHAQLARKRVGGDAADDGWYPLQVRCDARGAFRYAAWWRPDGYNVITMAAVWP